MFLEMYHIILLSIMNIMMVIVIFVINVIMVIVKSTGVLDGLGDVPRINFIINI